MEISAGKFRMFYIHALNSCFIIISTLSDWIRFAQVESLHQVVSELTQARVQSEIQLETVFIERDQERYRAEVAEAELETVRAEMEILRVKAAAVPRALVGPVVNVIDAGTCVMC